MLTQRTLAREGRIIYGMASEKVHAIYERYPWLRKYVPFGKASHIYLVGFEDALLEYPLAQPEEFRHITYVSTTEPSEKVWFLDAAGEVITRKGSFRFPLLLFLLWGPRLHTFTINYSHKAIAEGSFSSIERVISWLDTDALKIRFAVSYFSLTYAAIIYKVPDAENLETFSDPALGLELDIAAANAGPSVRRLG